MRKTPQRVRYRTIAAVAVGVAVTLTLAACSSSAGTSATASGAPVSGGTLRFAVNADATCPLDPHQSPASLTGLLARPVVDSLVSLAANGTIHPWLATSWSVSADQKTYTFTLRTGVKFSDGEAFNAAAVKANLDQIVSPATKSQQAAGFLAQYAGSTVIDPTHIAIHLKSPDSTLLTNLSSVWLGMEAPGTLTEPLSSLCTKIVGSGPFTTAGYSAAKGVSYVRNPDYQWGPATAAHTGPAYLAGISVTVIPQDTSRLGALTSGQVDAIADVPPVDVKQLESTSGFQVQTYEAPGGVYSYYPNVSKGPFTNVDVRKAFLEGIDWSTLVNKLFFGVYQPAKGPLSPTTFAYDKATESAYAYNLAAANKLLDEAGWTGRDSAGYRTKDGVQLTLTHPFLASRASAADATFEVQVQAAAKQLGIDVQNENVEYSTYLQDFVTGNYDLFDFDWEAASPSVLQTLFGSANVSKDGAFATNASRLSDPLLDKDFAEALATTNPAEQVKLYADAQQRIADLAAVFPVNVAEYVLGASDSVHGIEFAADSYPTFYDAWKSS
jgi:peptide/nickel transport system substrate-binding protein